MEVSTEIVQNLRVLGLPSDASADDVRSAFRRLARTYHPDVAGKVYSRKFERIAKAYALLKDSQLTEISHARVDGDPARTSASTPHDVPRGYSFSGIFSKPFAWYRGKKRERAAARNAEREHARRAADDARKKFLLEREARAEVILKRGERLIEDFTSRAARKERKTQSVGINGLALRLSSDICPVRHLALEHLGDMANSPEIFNAILAALQKWDIDEKTARLVSALPLTPENHSRLARELAGRAAAMPDSLLSYLLRLYNISASDRQAADPGLLENYLSNAGASGVALILRRWPIGVPISEPTLCRLISRDDESVLITIFSTMKRRSVPCPAAGRERLNAHLSHSNIAVRVWAKALLNIA